MLGGKKAFLCLPVSTGCFRRSAFVGMDLATADLPVDRSEDAPFSGRAQLGVCGVYYALSDGGAVWMAEPYGKPVYNRERMGDICTKTRILARLLITLSWTAVLTGGGILATEAMKKFAGVNHAYFQLAMEGSFIQMIVVFGAVLPMLYLVIFLWFYRRSGIRRNISSYLLALLLTNLLSENLNRNLRFWEGSWQMDLVWLAAAAILSFICLYLAAYLEETTE